MFGVLKFVQGVLKLRTFWNVFENLICPLVVTKWQLHIWRIKKKYNKLEVKMWYYKLLGLKKILLKIYVG